MLEANKTLEIPKDKKPSVSRRMSVIKRKAISMSKGELREKFDRNIEKQARLTLNSEKQHDLVSFLHRLEEQHGKDFSEKGLENLSLVSQFRDSERVKILSWMETKIEEILFLISEKKLLETIQHAYELSTIAKTFIHTNAAFYCLKLLGSLLMHLKYTKDSINIFTTMRDLGYELLNWSYVI